MKIKGCKKEISEIATLLSNINFLLTLIFMAVLMFDKSYRICMVDGKAWKIEIFLISKLAIMIQYRLKLLTQLPRFCRGRFADQHLVLALAMTRRAKILLRFYLGLPRHKIPR